MCSNVSYANAEYVVKPPQNPTRIAVRQVVPMAARSSVSAATKPTTNDPSTLTVSVPYGNVLAEKRCTTP